MDKNHFLQNLTSSKTKYKRLPTSTIRYAGGKSLGVGHIIELLPEHITKVVSPFFGGGSVEIAMSKYLDMEVIGYDIFNILVNYWNIQINQRASLYAELQKLQPNQQTYDSVKNKLEDHWDKTTKTFDEWCSGCKRFKRYKKIQPEEMQAEWDRKRILNELELAVYYFFNFNLSYGPGFLGWASKVYLDDKKYTKMIDNVKEFEPKNLQVSCGDFEDVIKKHSNEFLYCDPPYLIGEESKMFKGIYPMRNIPIHHNGFKHDKLAELLNNHKGGFILSYNDCPQIRDMYKNFKQSFPIWQYTMGQGETRIGKNRVEQDIDHVKESHEILIFSPPSS